MLKSAYFFLNKYFADDADSAQVRTLFRLLAIGLAGMQVWAAISSQSMNPDGISYLDIGDAYFRADWENAINPVWSPFYSWLLGFANLVFKPPMPWQFPTVHIVNFSIYLTALLSFEFMWGRVRTNDIEHGSLRISTPLWWALGYLLFIWISLSLIQIWSVTPDMLMATFVFLSAGLIAKIRAGEKDLRIFLLLGLVLGLGYLSKTIMFLIALVFLGITAFIGLQSKTSFSKLLFAVVTFFIICLPFILLISAKKDKFTIGEVGTLTYARYVNGVPYPHWQGDPSNKIVLNHPSRLIHQTPPVYEFGDPIGGTYPISTDPSYWYDGLEIQFNLAGLLARLLASGLYYVDLFIEKQGMLIASIIVLYFMRQRQNVTFFEILKRWAFVIPAVIAFGLYGAAWVEDRYVGVFVLLFWADILANVRLADTGRSRSFLRFVGALAALGLLVNILAFNLDGFNRLNPALQARDARQVMQPARPLGVARALHEVGVSQGVRVGVIGYGFDSFWARLAGVKIVAEMLDAQAEDFWMGDDLFQQKVLQAFAGSGAKAVVAEKVPEYARLNGWYQVGNSNYYIYLFTEQ